MQLTVVAVEQAQRDFPEALVNFFVGLLINAVVGGLSRLYRPIGKLLFAGLAPRGFGRKGSLVVGFVYRGAAGYLARFVLACAIVHLSESLDRAASFDSPGAIEVPLFISIIAVVEPTAKDMAVAS